MKFWALAYQYQDDVFYDFAIEETTLDLSETCFLPTKEVAEDFISQQLDDEYIPVEIELETLQKNGIWSYTRGRVERWDEDFE
ncbi:hypothetical protein [Bacillus cereus group sp. N21]|uniref:hypothetical protein n=1 Tax=Bacillus cereus group sp. N21 TaxID=2794591 RepID=UPI0018F2C43F|nr:hypothetical protein [Bacillus cereus group sp. N21]MBJ8031981.1 hypothetical protein [Bacillus cereus group sp. N21]